MKKRKPIRRFGAGPVLGMPPRDARDCRHAVVECDGARICISYRVLDRSGHVRMMALLAEMHARQRAAMPEAGTSGQAAGEAMRSDEEITSDICAVVADAVEDILAPDGADDDGALRWSSALIPLEMPAGADSPAAYWGELEPEERRLAMTIHSESIFGPLLRDGALLRRAPARLVGEFQGRPGGTLLPTRDAEAAPAPPEE